MRFVGAGARGVDGTGTDGIIGVDGAGTAEAIGVDGTGIDA